MSSARVSYVQTLVDVEKHEEFFVWPWKVENQQKLSKRALGKNIVFKFHFCRQLVISNYFSGTRANLRKCCCSHNFSVYFLGFPSERLFLRWLGVNLFMPSLQFSIPPWHYKATSECDPVRATLKLLQTRQVWNDAINYYAGDSVYTGYPIVRPMWWVNGSDPVTWDIDDQFLLGDALIVAPIVDENVDYRDIYLPDGTWYDNLRTGFVNGPKWLKNYTAALDEVPNFGRF